MSTLERVLVVIPTYDEIENIEPILRRLAEAVPAAHALVVDDASPDGTGELAEKVAAGDDRVHVLHRSGKAGLGAAYLAGFKWALDRDYDAVVEMDADGSHAPEELPRLLRALDGADVVIGSRWVDGGEVRNWPRSRLLLSRGGNLYVRAVLRIPVRDATAGFRAYRSPVLRRLGLEHVTSQGYCFQVDLAWRAVRAGLRVVEVPITFVERVRGASKMDTAIVTEALWRVSWWAVCDAAARLRHPSLGRAAGRVGRTVRRR
ncbi:MAG: polyprenol monophosphomannose synthase [Mycobacteriales bacterium]|nr:MAG: dolichol-phosphate mannosyltransferase [Pseudonocardiales bacterium]